LDLSSVNIDLIVDLGPPITLGAATGARLIVWCEDCGRQVEPQPDEMAAQYCTETRVLDWRDRMACLL
jgi:hypothetical protein